MHFNVRQHILTHVKCMSLQRSANKEKNFGSSLILSLTHKQEHDVMSEETWKIQIAHINASQYMLKGT